MDKETEFFLKKMEFDYGDDKVVGELKEISKKISWLRGWPEEKKAFWNGEAFMWRNKISKGKREGIRKELAFLEGGRNLDLGCGSYSYITSVGLDISEKMLLLNGNLSERIGGDLEEKLPFKEGEFDSATLIFVLDYVKNYKGLLKEIWRVLKEKGVLVVAGAASEVNEWQRQKRVNNFSFKKWERLLEGAGFKVEFYEEERLGFWKGRKEN